MEIPAVTLQKITTGFAGLVTLAWEPQWRQAEKAVDFTCLDDRCHECSRKIRMRDK